MPEETVQRPNSTTSKVVYLLIGVGLGSLIGVLFAPKSGEATREHLSDKANDLKVKAFEAVEQGKTLVADTKDRLADAVDTGRKTYQQEISKAKAAGSGDSGV